MERVHRSLTADKEERVVLRPVEVGQSRGTLKKRDVLRALLEAHADEIIRGVAGFVLGIAVAICLDRPSCGACNRDLEAPADELPEGVGEFGPPESNGPACLA